MRGLLGKKVGMTQIFGSEGEVIPVTVIEAGPCYVTQIRTPDRDGYAAIQIGFEEVPEKRLNRPQRGHLRPVGKALRYLREIQVSNIEDYQVGQKLDVSIFEPGERVDVTGRSKGRGFAGTIKRHGFRRQRRTHGQSDRERAPGSIGATTTPGRVHKGKRMAGRMGNERVTVQNLEVVMVDPEHNLLVVRGAVPGPRNGLLLIREARKQG